MELQFNKNMLTCLHSVVAQCQNQEQTQELRLSEAMPDIGRVLGCWGQVLIRGKEWRTGSMSVSAGVMAWVLYAPEDGTEPRVVDTWIPFQMRWDLPETQRDGIIQVCGGIKSMDCRSISARKIMVRFTASICAEAFEPRDTEIYQPDSLPEGVALLRQTYPMDLPREAGEKPFQMEEELILPSGENGVGKLIYYQLRPEIAEQRIMADKLVFRGVCRMHMLLKNPDGTLQSDDIDFPFSQFTDLDQTYGNDATGAVLPIVTGAEIEQGEDGKLLLKCAMAAQYVIYDRMLLELVEDAYCPGRKLELKMQELKLPVRLDVVRENLPYRQNLSAQAQQLVDCAALWDVPAAHQMGDNAQITQPAQYQALFFDENGALQSKVSRAEESFTLSSDRGNRVSVTSVAGVPQGSVVSDGVEISGELEMTATVHSQQGLPMVTALVLGETVAPDEARPSLILRRCGEKRLWDLAKEYGSTVEAIAKANQLQSEPEADCILLIPVP